MLKNSRGLLFCDDFYRNAERQELLRIIPWESRVKRFPEGAGECCQVCRETGLRSRSDYVVSFDSCSSTGHFANAT